MPNFSIKDVSISVVIKALCDTEEGKSLHPSGQNHNNSRSTQFYSQMKSCVLK